MRLRLVLAAGAGVLALVAPAAHATVPATDCHGVAFTDASNDQYLGSSANTVVRPTVALDIRRVFFTGSGATQRVNIEVGELASWNNTEYRFSWNDDVNFTYSWQFVGQFLGANGTADVSTQAILQHNDINGSWVSLSGHASVTAYHGAAGQPGVISFGLPDASDYGPGGFPSTVSGMHAEAVQYESNVVTDVAVRQDTATAGTSWSQPC
jgi:hypothetical protein